ncbi:hypothetical protein E1269_28735 [Jiangella asiatica]|uniref:Uncharacterized protein n=1 Tax=Jiangella asiatica TaxID=2530372 RepID=A0A4R5CDZ3_9ACTN|nr:hypothetical protein E1269_28735 [Jiangella asiatica]
MASCHDNTLAARFLTEAAAGRVRRPRSLRAFLAAGFAPIGSEVLIRPARRARPRASRLVGGLP